MRYIRLNNDTIILHTSIGLRTITRKSFNYHKIQKYINNGMEEEDILPLLIVPPLPNGTYEAYKIGTELTYLHTTIEGEQVLRDIKADSDVPFGMLEREGAPEAEFVGIYASIEDLIADWPEYLF